MKHKNGIKKVAAPVFILIVTLLTSCNKYLTLEPISSFGPETVFGTVDNAEKALIGAYQQLGGDHAYGSRLSIYLPFDTDDMMGANGDGDNGRKDLNRYNLTAGNGQLTNPFKQLYRGVERANLCIKHIPKMELYLNGNAKEQALLKRLHGEALTLRAQFYFDLVKIWGDLPAQWEPSEDQADLFLAKTDRDSIYEHILNDLLTAESLVPWRSELAALGEPIDERITKGAVKGLRARIALFRGGYSLRRSRKMERGSNYLDYYKIASAECLSIMQSKEHALDPSFEDLWKNNVNAHRIDPFGEIMFEVAMGGTMSSTDGKVAYFNGPGGQVMPLPTYFYSFDSLDTRRDVTIAPFTVNTDRTLKATELSKMADGKFRINWVSNPVMDIAADPQFMGLNWPLLRYSDVLLMYAEAENEIKNGPTAEAIQAFNQVRKRAFLGFEDKIGTPPSDKEGFFQAIVNERCFEFGGEAIRKYDLTRWNILGQKLAEAKAKMAALGRLEAPYNGLAGSMYFLNNSTTMKWANSFYKPAPASTPAGTTKVTWVAANTVTKNNWPKYAIGFIPNKSEIYPIPQEAIDANPNLKQDYGY